MSLNSAENITIRSWDTITMPDTVISRVGELSSTEKNRFIFTDCRGCPIGDVDITVVDRDADDSKKNPGPTRTSSRVPGNRRDRGGDSHIISKK